VTIFNDVSARDIQFYGISLTIGGRLRPHRVDIIPS
jgi:2-keto-4-pentenoate hydratase/2-oxohepta-3-ene-1,7-dioic acid hydratase in catechol pathway